MPKLDTTEVMDRALDAAEDKLRKLLPKTRKGRNAAIRGIVLDFVNHCARHLAIELANIAHHGHKNDDPECVPPGRRS